MLSRRMVAAYLGLAAFFLVAGLADGQAAPAAGAKPRSSAHVYILRGFMNMSPGLDELAAKIERYGIPASVSNHNAWSSFAQDAISKYKQGHLRSIIIVGHSMGGGAALDMAAELGRSGVPVNLIVSIDPVGTSAVPSNVRRTVNLYIPGGLGSPMQSAKARGPVQNVRESNPAIGHFSIIEARQRQVLGYVLSSARGGGSTENTPKPSETSGQAQAGGAAPQTPAAAPAPPAPPAN